VVLFSLVSSSGLPRFVVSFIDAFIAPLYPPAARTCVIVNSCRMWQIERSHS